MDPQHQQWRPGPPIPGTFCPICSFSHFPFCPPHPPFNQKPIFPNDSGHPFQRPGFGPYMGTQSPFVGNPNGFENPTPWQRAPNFDVDSYGKFPYRDGLAPPPQGPPPYEYGGNAYVSEGDRNFKRPRVDGLGLKTEFNPNNASFSLDNERRLKLIHDHGGVGSVSDCNTIPNGETNRYADQSKDSRRVNDSQHSHVNVPYYDHTNQLPQPYGMQRHAVRQSLGQQHMPGVAPHGTPITNENGGYFSPPASGRFVSENAGHMRASRSFSGQPPLPTTPPPPLPMEPPSKSPSSLFPVSFGSSPMMSSAYPPYPESHSPARPYFHSKPFSHASTGYIMEQSHAAHQISSKQYIGEGYPFPRKQSSLDKPKVIDATHLFKQPHRVTRPDHFVIILRGLPGSGKSYLAKMLRDLEVENGGTAPRIHSMDDYFMTEVEKVEESDVSKSSSSARGKKRVVKKVMEYCYEPEMEEAYRSSMLKAFKKTLEESVFTFIIVDDRNLRVADFAQFWAIAKSSGYEVYILEAPYKDPAGCAARNVHGFTQDDIQKIAGQWEEAPTLYLQLDTKSLFHGDGLKESDIQEVDMDTEDADNDGSSGLEERKPEKIVAPPAEDDAHIGSSHGGKSLDAGEDHPTAEVKELGRSKWSEVLYDDDTEKAEGVKGKFNALSGLITAYRKEAKSVCWSDQVGYTGFSIAAAKKANVMSLVIGPGSGYDLRSQLCSLSMNGCQGVSHLPLGTVETRSFLAVPTPSLALDRLSSAILELNSDPPPSSSGIIRLRVPVQQQFEAIDWLYAQDQFLPRCFISGKGQTSNSSNLYIDSTNGNDQHKSKNNLVSVAGVGSAVFFQDLHPFSYRHCKSLKRFLSAECPLIGAYGAIRFDARTNISSEWEAFGYFLFYGSSDTE